MPIFDPAVVKSAAMGDAAFQLSLRFLTGKVRFSIGDDSYLLDICDGKFVDFRQDDGSAKADVTFSGTVKGWENLLLPEIPPPGCQSPFYNDGRSEVHYEGDTVGAVGLLAFAIGEFYRVLRGVTSGKQIDAVLPEVDREFDAAVGRYMYLHIQGVQYRVYYEESGEGGIPLLLQHTAGADSRQARHVLEDPDFRKHFRIIAYDMPFHGNSLPPTSHKWWEEPYLLTKSFLIDLVLGICGKLNLDRPVFMGSAMGGMLGLDLAYDHPEKFRAIISLNAGPPAIFPADVVDKMATFAHPQLSSKWISAMMTANMAATSPGIYRRELGWVYGQSAPGAAGGALHYYMNDHDLTPEQAATIDTSKVPVYLFTGHDDSMGGEYGTDLMARAMVGTPYQKLQRLGHFGTAENPEAFKQDIWPTIEEIIARES